MAIERFINDFQTTLNGSILSGTNPITVTAGTSIAAQFRCRIDDEILIVTAGGDGTSWTVTRGAESTTAAAHSNGATVTVVQTAGSFEQAIADRVRTGTYANLPATSDALEGHIYLAEDSGFDQIRFNGSAWKHYKDGFIVTPPQVGDLTWVNQDTATAVNTNGPLVLTSPANSSFSTNILKATAPATPWTVTVFVKTTIVAANFNAAGLVFRQSSDGKLHGFACGFNSGSGGFLFDSGKYTNPTTFSANYTTLQNDSWGFGRGIWLQIGDDGANRVCKAGISKNQLKTIHSVGRTDFLTADEYGIFVKSENATHGVIAIYYDLGVA